MATKTADRSLQPPAPAAGTVAPGAWIRLRRGGRSFKGCVESVADDHVKARFQAEEDSDQEDDRQGEVVGVRLRGEVGRRGEGAEEREV